MTDGKGRFSRWSSLKTKGGASDVENEMARKEAEANLQPESAEASSATQVENDLAITGNFPEKKYKRDAAPVMAPLAGLEDDDSDFEAPPEAALAMLQGDIAHDPAPGVNAVAPITNATEEEEPELSEEEAAYVETLPAIEGLTNESDFTPFMSDKVPEFIRKKALRVLYQSHPILGFRDGLNDYDHDYNLIDTLIDAATQSSYEVGKGQKAAQEPDPETELAQETDTEEAQSNEPEADTPAPPQGDEAAEKTSNDDDTKPESGKESNTDDASKTELASKSESPSTRSLRDVRVPASRDKQL